VVDPAVVARVVGQRGIHAGSAGSIVSLRSSRIADAVAGQTTQVAHLRRRAEHALDGRVEGIRLARSAAVAWSFASPARHGRQLGVAALAATRRPVRVPVVEHGAAADVRGRRYLVEASLRAVQGRRVLLW
jgi:hypothetical protein